MKTIPIIGIAIITPITLLADPATDQKLKTPPITAEKITQSIEKHSAGAKKLATEQDQLSADVQDLIDEQTDPEIIDLLRQIEIIMADATDRLAQQQTGGPTIATETEIIEKIFEAAKKKQQKQGGT